MSQLLIDVDISLIRLFILLLYSLDPYSFLICALLGLSLGLTFVCKPPI